MESSTTSVHFDLETHVTDFFPDAQAANTLRALINEQDAQLKSLDVEIAQLKDRWSEVAKSRDIHRALLAPIRKLPPEILGQIFVQFLLGSIHDSSQFNPSCWNCSELDDVRIPLLLVCQRWKRTAIGTPRLWTILAIGNVSSYNTARVQMCLHNSGSLPIQIKFVNTATWGWGQPPEKIW